MKFALEIDMNGDAFIDHGAAQVASILVDLAPDVLRQAVGVQTSFVLRDVNGNRVGVARYLADGDSL